jgi:hypothetical protein
MDQSMSAFHPHTTTLGGWSHLSFIVRNTKPLEIEFKNSFCVKAGVMMMLDIQWENAHIHKLKYNHQLGATTCACLHLAEWHDPHDGDKECTKGDAWFGSTRAAVFLGKEGHKAFR